MAWEKRFREYGVLKIPDQQQSATTQHHEEEPDDLPF